MNEIFCDFSVIIPCYNEEDAVHATLKMITEHAPREMVYEIIAVNDASTDKTVNKLHSFSSLIPITVLSLPARSGYGAAIKAGIKQSKSQIMVITDCDGSYPVEQIGKLVSLMVDSDMVVGARNEWGENYPISRRIPKLILRNFASFLVGARIPDVNSGLRVFRRELADRFTSILPDTFSFTTTITMCCLLNGSRVTYFPILYNPRIGHSKIKPFQDTLLFAKLLIRIGILFAPLRIIVPIVTLAIVLTITSVLGDLINHRLFGESSFWFALASVNSFICLCLIYRLTKDAVSRPGKAIHIIDLSARFL